MRIVDLIEKKRDGHALTTEEINFIIEGYVAKDIPDYQISALLMAIYFNGMTTAESTALTMAMLHSGETIDLSAIKGIKVDKHSTGGVGDKTTLVLGPLVAAAGAKVAKLSGRGLGHTGGTLDKLESIPGLSIAIDPKDFSKQVNDIGIAVAGQTANVCPADKLLYALRDVTATVPSIPLIASSIMSKKLASGSDVIVLDVKIGDGAFMKTLEDAKELSKVMVGIGTEVGKEVVAFITDMNQPLGFTVGNKLEVVEALETLQGKGPEDLTTLCVEIGSYMVYSAKITDSIDAARELVQQQITNKHAHDKQLEFLQAQGGKLPDLEQFIHVKDIVSVHADTGGYIASIKALDIGLAAMKLGAGRATKEDTIDPDVGIKLHKKVGDYVDQGDVLASIYTNTSSIDDIIAEVQQAYTISKDHVDKTPIIYEIITKEDI
ncbi:pyrimidine-nucleoside phosphorylase [Candidatus Xianfuyuplasma coldseepsis]|uniref:Pyrimidine-nucleoside phosphorylase n=1 Tax=Candidatus Xianfuyuplasma coldseepsis TaxID=2782163 RepID=A0A7L7KSM5_9MOLU|nr:pyrimidine-nucleoside phosphorylase [Xianfuyuplasma coldseepsis]QMS85820.1 pyrimidine-nucleoside phosphorylase [Xianfuyuplasma coldseepsis]